MNPNSNGKVRTAVSGIYIIHQEGFWLKSFGSIHRMLYVQLLYKCVYGVGVAFEVAARQSPHGTLFGFVKAVTI